jgi:hypothetical protein
MNKPMKINNKNEDRSAKLGRKELNKLKIRKTEEKKKVRLKMQIKNNFSFGVSKFRIRTKGLL